MQLMQQELINVVKCILEESLEELNFEASRKLLYSCT